MRAMDIILENPSVILRRMLKFFQLNILLIS